MVSLFKINNYNRKLILYCVINLIVFLYNATYFLARHIMYEAIKTQNNATKFVLK